MLRNQKARRGIEEDVRGETVPADHRRGTIEDTFAAFYRSEYPAAVRLALALTQWRDGSEDIVQESFARVQPRFGSLERPGGYLRVTVVNMCREAERRRRREHLRLGLMSSGLGGRRLVHEELTCRPGMSTCAVGFPACEPGSLNPFPEDDNHAHLP
ncbi:MAG: hypothetical protein M3Y04_00880 [Actinomycetota bacterium]|nr:hypothetical protein [Actinomycetota bacterium]